MAVASKFAQAMKAKANAWKKAAKAEPRKGGQFGPADVPTGYFEAIVSGENNITEKKGSKPGGIPWVRIKATISDGEHQGKEPSQFYYLEGKVPSDDPEAMMTNEEKLAGDLKIILHDLDIEKILEKNPEQMESLIAEVNKRSPKMKIYVRNSIGKAGTKNAGKAFQDVYFNELLDGGTSNGESQEEEESGEEASEEEEVSDEEVTEEESEEEAEESTDDEPAAPAVGDPAMYKGKGMTKAKEWKITTVNNKERTVTLKGHGKTVSKVSWDKLS